MDVFEIFNYRSFLRSARSSRLRLRISLFFVCICLCGMAKALAQWQIGQRSQPLSILSATDTATFADQTDLRAIHALLKPILVERIVDTPAHHEVGEYLKRTVETYGFTATWDEFFDDTPLGKKKFRNLIATFNPQNNVPRRLVLACHYDSKYIKGVVFKAATDSALPCALLLDLARTLSSVLNKRTNKEITLQLVFLDGEEAFHEWTPTDSIYGARHLAKAWENCWYPSTNGSSFNLCKEIDRVDAFVLLDLLGANRPYPRIYSTYGHGTTRLFQHLPAIEKALRKMKKLRNIPQIFRNEINPYAIEDDHIPFLQRGVPIMHLIPVPFPEVWHKASDDETALDNDVIFNIATIIRLFVASYLGVHPLYNS